MKTQVGIVGGGPAGLMLSHLLAGAGIDSVVVELRSRDYLEKRVRAGVLEHGTVQTLVETGLGERLQRESLHHGGVEMRFGAVGHRIDFQALTGRGVTVYGQQEVVKDLIGARMKAGADIRFEASGVALSDLETDRPKLRFDYEGRSQVLECDFVAGCDGFHGICRSAIPSQHLKVYDRVYPFAWLGILAEAPASSEELVYAAHDRGFALLSMRSPTLARLYVQCGRDDALEDWPDRRVWDELHARFELAGGFELAEGPVIERVLAAMRGFVVEPMQYRRLFLAGDAAHIVPPTGAKGLNLAIADVRLLAEALSERYRTGSFAGLDCYSERCLPRAWRAQHFSWWMTAMLHRFEDDDAYQRKLQLAQLEHLCSSEAAARSMAENYVDLNRLV